MNARKRYVPEAGDIVWLEFDPQAGHEQAGRRPALVISPADYNLKTSLMICCPTTTQIKGYPFEIPINSTPPSVVLADQVKSLDWVARKAELKEKAQKKELEEVKYLIKLLIH